MPQWVVPFCAEFRKPFSDDFLADLKTALQYIRDSSKLQLHSGMSQKKPQTHMILIPIKSPGGTEQRLICS